MKKIAKKIICANWKMNPPTLKEAEKLFKSAAKSASRTRKTEVVICPPFVYLEKLKFLGRRNKKISFGGQNAFVGETGPFTGEISPEMLYNLGAKYVILGHSERRALGEGDHYINKKLKSALASSLTPILCVGERVRDERHQYFHEVRKQIEECLSGINRNLFSKVIIAYEPVWAISSSAHRHDATAKDSKEMAMFIRKTLSDLSRPEIANKTRIIYGGSVNERDAGDFLRDGGVDGVLPGKASLDAKKFAKIVDIAEHVS